MQNTSNYNLNIVEGTDIVNIPVQLNPNFQTIDSEMFKNKQGSTGTATEVVTGTVHAIVRANTDADVFRFTATGNWASGDTMTVDGGAVTVHLTDGTAPGAGAYVIGAEVVAVINGTLVTLISSSATVDPGVTSFNTRVGAVTPAASDYDASMIDYDNTSSGLVATDVQSAIDEVVNSIPSGITIVKKQFTPQTTAAGAYSTYFDGDIKNKAVVGYRFSGVASYNICISACFSDASGLQITLKNNDASPVTPTGVEAYYID